MKKYIAFVFCLLAISCKKNVTEKPLFLDFYPSMDTEDFEEKISELTKKGILEEGNFIILIKNKKIPFSINASNGSSLPKSVFLVYEEEYNEKNKLTNDIKVKYNNNIIGITEFLKNKYPLEVNIKNLKDFQTKRTIKNYNFFFEDLNIIMPVNNDYIVFRDNLKTIVLSYTQLENKFIKSKELTLNINIGYYYNSVFDSVLNESMNFKVREKEIKLEEQNEKIKQIESKQKIIKKNIESL